MNNALKQFERIIFHVLIFLGVIFIIYQTIDLIWLFGGRIYKSFASSTFYVSEEGKPIAALFFGILLSLEIVETIKIFSKGHMTKVRIILIVGLIAVTRKILMISDVSEIEPMAEFAMASLILALSAGYYLVTRVQPTKSETSTSDETV